MRRPGRLGHDPAEDFDRVRAVERRLATQDLVEDRPQAIHIRLAVDQFPTPLGLLRAHVGGRPEDLPLHRLVTALGVLQRHRRRERLIGAADDLGQAPVEHDDFAEVAQDNVLTLQVAMDHAPAVGVGHGMADAYECLEQLAQLERADSTFLPSGMVLRRPPPPGSAP